MHDFGTLLMLQHVRNECTGTSNDLFRFVFAKHTLFFLQKMSVSDHSHKEQKVRDLRTAPGEDKGIFIHSRRTLKIDSFNEKRVNSKG